MGAPKDQEIIRGENEKVEIFPKKEEVSIQKKGIKNYTFWKKL